MRPGDEVEAEIGFANSGSGAASDAVLQFKFDSGFDDVRVTENGADVALDGESAELGTIEPYARRSFVFRGHVRSPYPDRSELRCSAVLHAREIAEVPLGEAVWRVDSRPEFSVESSQMTLQGDAPLRPNCTTEVDVHAGEFGNGSRARRARASIRFPRGATGERGRRDARKEPLLFGDIAPAATATARLAIRLLRCAGDRRPVSIDAVLTAESMLPLPLGRLEIPTAATPDFSLAASGARRPPKSSPAKPRNGCFTCATAETARRAACASRSSSRPHSFTFRTRRASTACRFATSERTRPSRPRAACCSAKWSPASRRSCVGPTSCTTD